MPNQKKIENVRDLSELITLHKHLAVVRMTGKITHQQLETLRKDLKKTKAKIRVIKNTLLEKAINKLPKASKLPLSVKKSFFPLKNTNALLVLDKNWNDALKKAFEFMEKEKNLAFHFAILDSMVYEADDVIKIAQLPSKEQLIAKVIGSFKSPVSRLNNSILFGLRNFVHVLKSKSQNTN